MEGRREEAGGETRGTDGEGLSRKSPGEAVRDGGAEEGGGGVSWEGGGGRRPRLVQLPGRDGWGPWQGERDEEEERDMEKEREGEGVRDTRGGWSCRGKTPLLGETWGLCRTGDRLGTLSSGGEKLEWRL